MPTAIVLRMNLRMVSCPNSRGAQHRRAKFTHTMQRA